MDIERPRWKLASEEEVQAFLEERKLDSTQGLESEGKGRKLDVDKEKWKLGSPLKITNLTFGDFLANFEVEHNLKAFHDPGEDDLPRVTRLTLERIDGQPISPGRTIPIDMTTLAIEGVLAAINLGFFEVRIHTGEWRDLRYGPPTAENWREVAHLIRVAAVGNRRSVKWTEELDKRFVELWSHVVTQHGGTADDLSHELGITTETVHWRLSHLRKKGLDIPPARRGRPPKKKEEQ